MYGNLQKCTVLPEFREIRLKLLGNCAFLQKLHTRKLGEVTVLYAVNRQKSTPLKLMLLCAVIERREAIEHFMKLSFTTLSVLKST